MEVDGAEEPMWKLKHRAYKARKALREGRRLATQIDRGIIEWASLNRDEQDLIGDYNSDKLHAQVDQANLKYGHGIARTNDFGFKPGDNMCTDVPIEARAQLRTLQTALH